MKPYKILCVLSSFLLLAGCASQSGNQTTAHVGNEVFFTNASLLKPVSSKPGVKLYINPKAKTDTKGIRTIYIAPVKLWVDPASEYKDITDADIADFTTKLREAYQEDPAHQLKLVETPSPDTLIVRSALTDVRLTKSRTRLLSFTPVGLVVKGIKHAADISPITVNSLGIVASGKTSSGKTIFLISLAPSAVATNPDGSAADTSRLDQMPDRLIALGNYLRTELGKTD